MNQKTFNEPYQLTVNRRTALRLKLSTEQIAQDVGRPVKTIQKYFAGELVLTGFYQRLNEDITKALAKREKMAAWNKRVGAFNGERK